MSARGAAVPADEELADGDWLSRPEAGGWFAIRVIRFIAVHLGRGCARAALYPITLYFFFRRGPERRAARDYFQRLDGRPGSPWRVLRLIHSFAATILDRMFLLTGGISKFEITQSGVDRLRRYLAQGRGVLLLGAHVGSFDVLRALAADGGHADLRLVMDKHKTAALTRLLETLAPELAANVIDTARGGLDIVLALSEAARDGAMIALLGDRGRPHERMHAVPFLGGNALFPVAPWRLGAALGVPVVLCLGMYRGANRYDLVFETLAERVELPRTNRAAALDRYVRLYAARLEHYVRRTPYNWFNFYDFWQVPATPEVRSEGAEALETARAG